MKDSEKYVEEIVTLTAKKLELDISKFSMNELKIGMMVELEHGSVQDDTNITNDSPEETLKIVIAHLRELPDYYTRLEDLENEANKVNGVEPDDKMLKEATRYKELCGISENSKKQSLSNVNFKNNAEKTVLNEQLDINDFDIVKFSSSKPEKSEDDEELYKMNNSEE